MVANYSIPKLLRSTLAKGDMIIRDATPDWARLAIGTANQVVASISDVPTWRSLETLYNNIAGITLAQGYVLYRDGSGLQGLAPPTEHSYLLHTGATSNPAWGYWRERVKSANDTATSDTNLDNDTHLQDFDLEASTAYEVELDLYWDAPAAADIKYRLSYSGSFTTYYETVINFQDATESSTIDVYTSNAERSVTFATNSEFYFRIRAYMLTNAAGQLDFKFAQNSSSGSALTLYAGSAMRVRKATN